MNIINDFVAKIDELIIDYKNKISSNNVLISQNGDSSDKEIIKKILSDVDNINFITENIEIIKKYGSSQDLSFINAYINQHGIYKGIALKMFLDANKNHLIDRIKNIDSKIKVVDIINLQSENNKLNDRILKMEKIKESIAGNYLSEDDLASILHFCKLFEIDSVKLISAIVLNSMKKVYSEIEIVDDSQVQVVSENEVELTEEDLISLFSRYNCDFNKLSKAKKQKLTKFGNLDNIEAILKVFEKFNINLGEDYNNGTIFTEVGTIIDLFIYARADNVERQLENLKKYDLINNYKSLFETLKLTSIFIPRKINYKSKDVNGGDGDSIFLSGRLEDFSENLDYFYNEYKKLALKIKPDSTEEELNKGFALLVYNKCSFYFATPNAKVKTISNIFDKYGISKNAYLMTISSVIASNCASRLDEIIEIDCYDYFASNLSKIKYVSFINSLIFAKQTLGMDNDELFKTKTNSNFFRDSDTKLVVRANDLALRLERTGIPLNQLNPEPSYISDERKELFEQIDETVKEEFNKNEEEFFKNFDYNKSIVENKGFKYFNILNNFIDENNPLIIRIGGVPISRNKLIRIYSIYNNRSIEDSIDKLLYAITYNSHYTKEQVEIIENKIYEFAPKGKEKIK